jgi:hypothetical protein
MLCPVSMSENGAFAAIERIERALARIEAASAQPPAAQNNDLALAELSARHQALREETRRALADLDTLVGELANG